jgi:hypothetical protein
MDAIVAFLFAGMPANLCMMRHLQFTWDDFSERPRFSTLIIKGPAFWFDMSDITRIRTEFSSLIDNLSKLYLQEEEKAPREQAQQCAKQKESSKNVNDDAAMSTSKDEGNVEGNLARASVEMENSSPPPITMTLAGPQPTNPPHPLLLYLSSKVSHCLLPLSKFDIKHNLRAFDSLVYKDEGNVDRDSSTDDDDNDSPPNKKQPMQGEHKIRICI